MENTPAEKEKRGVNPVAGFLILLIAFYRYAISPLFASRCRYYPTCSAYADEAIRKHGVFRGVWLTVRRLSRCHPWGGSGVDLVPEPDSHTHTRSSHCCQRKP